MVQHTQLFGAENQTSLQAGYGASLFWGSGEKVGEHRQLCLRRKDLLELELHCCQVWLLGPNWLKIGCISAMSCLHNQVSELQAFDGEGSSLTWQLEQLGQQAVLGINEDRKSRSKDCDNLLCLAAVWIDWSL